MLLRRRLALYHNREARRLFTISYIQRCPPRAARKPCFSNLLSRSVSSPAFRGYYDREASRGTLAGDMGAVAEKGTSGVQGRE